MFIPRITLAVPILCILLLATLLPIRAFIYTPLRREDVSEGSCILPYPEVTAPSLTFVLKTTMRHKSPFYVPMGSEHLYRSYATYLLGRPPMNQGELEAMNLRIRWDLMLRFHTTGYKDKYFNQKCRPEGGTVFRESCFATRGSEGTNLDIIRQTTDTLVYTDNESVILIVRCVLGKENDWKVLSTKPEVDPEVKSKILEKVVELGFKNASYWTEYQYNSI